MKFTKRFRAGFETFSTKKAMSLGVSNSTIQKLRAQKTLLDAADKINKFIKLF